MLAKDPTQRIGDADQVAAAVEAIGESPDLLAAPTLDAPAKARHSLPDREQLLLSLVVALAPRDAAAAGQTIVSDDVLPESERHGALLTELRAQGARAELLIGGALVVTVPQMSSAKDQAAQAARFALMIQESWPEARIVVVTGLGTRSRGLLTGDVLDRAWRLLSWPATPAEPGSRSSTRKILVDDVSAGFLETRFELRTLPGGGSVLGDERLTDDTARLLLGQPTPCVGRERELSMLEDVLTECHDESVARAVLVLAPPGLGKSRLRHEFVRRQKESGEQFLILFGRSDPMTAKLAYGLLGEALRESCGIREGSALDEQQAHLRDYLGRHLQAEHSSRVTEFLGELCGIPFSDVGSSQLRAARQDPRVMSDQIELAFIDWLRATTQAQPVLLILEDLHWADGLTVKLVQAALRVLSDHALMVLALARPEVQELYPNLWAGSVQPLPLHPLPKKAGERLARQILGPQVAADVVARVVEQSAGNPLFLEELIRAAVERKTGELPETVVAMIQARIGRLSTGARRSLRAASVFGWTFWQNGVRSLLAATGSSETPGSALDELLREEIIEATRERRFAAEPEFRFRHTLVCDAAHGLLSEDELVPWHAAAGVFLEGLGERNAVVLAEHFRLGNQLERAVIYYRKAAEQAYDAADATAAQALVERGIACGAQGTDLGILLSVQAASAFWRGQLQEVLTLGPEAVTLLPVGSKPWCRVFEGLFPAAVILQQVALLGQFGSGSF